MVTNRESYYNYMLRRYREDRAKKAPTLEEKVNDLERRVVTLEGHLEKMSRSFKKTPWRPNPLDGC